MRWLQRLPGTRREPAGREWWLWRRLPAVLAWGTALPLALGALLWATAAPLPGNATDAGLWLWLYRLAGLVLLHWTLVGTLALGCVIVMVMKGPGYVADAYPPPGRDAPG